MLHTSTTIAVPVPHLFHSLLWLILLLACSPALARMTIEVGPTSIPRGDANGQQDITVSNGLFALGFAVESAPPWGVARGGIVDIAIIRDGRVGNDFASLVDFMPNDWSAWPTTYQRVEVVKQSPEEITIRSRRDWGEVELETHFRILRNDNRVRMTTVMHNTGKNTLPNLSTGYVSWPDGGYLFGVPGLEGQKEAAEDTALGDWSAAYDKDWALALHAPFAEKFRRYGRDRYRTHTLAAGEKRVFEAWLQIESRGELAPMVRTEIALQQLSSGTLSGQVRSSDGKRVDQAAVIIQKDGRTLAWALGAAGAYHLELPAGDYSVYATARGHSPGAATAVTVKAGVNVELDHRGLQPPGSVAFDIKERGSGEALDARISISQGYKPLIQYLGDTTFFTDLNRVGHADITMAPGDYVFTVSAGGGFTAPVQSISARVEPGAITPLSTEIPVLMHPSDTNWYAIDLHHHSDVLDGFTAPEYVLRSELAAGLDFSSLSDHNATINNAEMKRLSAQRSIPFLSGTELSPSWAHFNAYPVAVDASIDIDVSTATVQEIFALARGLGAKLVQLNHPYSAYGYFRNLETRVMIDGKSQNGVPGGYDPAFDLVEIKDEDQHENVATMTKVWQLWNGGHRAYLSGGSDVHDVWLDESGLSRTYAYIEAQPNPENLITALKQGHSFASQGPLIFPDIMFGSELEHPVNKDLALNYQLTAVSGLRSVSLIERGRTIESRTFETPRTTDEQKFTVYPRSDTWYSLVVEDAKGKFAYSNPLWVKLMK